MAKYNTYMNELPENDSSHPWTKVSENGSIAIDYNKLVYASGSDRVYKREDGQAKTDDVDIRLSLKFMDGIASNQYIFVDDGVDKKIEVFFSDSGVKINGGSWVSLTVGSYASLRIKKTGQTSVDLYKDDMTTPVSTVTYASVPTASSGTAKVENKFIAAANQEVWVDYFNYAIGEDADGVSADRITTLMTVLPDADPSHPWVLGSSDGNQVIENGLLVVSRDGGTSANTGYSRTSDVYDATDELDVVARVNLRGSASSFKLYVNDGVKLVLLTVERTAVNGYRYYLNSEVPQALEDGIHLFRIVKAGETGVKVYLDNAVSATYSLAYAGLAAHGTKKIEMLMTADSVSADNKVYVDHVNYGINIDAYENALEATEINVMKIQPESGALQEHDPDVDAVKFSQVKSKKLRSDGDMSIKTESGDIQLHAFGDLSFVSHVTEASPPIGDPDSVIGGAFYIGDETTETQAIKFASDVDATYSLPSVDGVDPNSILHTLKLLSLKANEMSKSFTAGETIPAGKAVRFSAANTVVVASSDTLDEAKVVGIAETTAANPGDSVLITLEGGVANDVLIGAAVNATYYLTSSGGFSTSVPGNPGDVVLQIGYASSSTSLFLAYGVPYQRA
jgi:hypothetical protein